MLRFISVVGIALAMVIGFIAISKKMKDDFTVRSQVIDVIKQMKSIAAEELQCGITGSRSSMEDKAEPETMPKADSARIPAIEMPPELEPIPLIEKLDAGSTSSTPSEEAPDSGATEEAAVSENGPNMESETLINKDITRNADVLQALGYQMMDSGTVEVIAVFRDIHGESGKMRVKAGSRVVISCACESEALSCNTVESSVNKNYIPKVLTKQ